MNIHPKLEEILKSFKEKFPINVPIGWNTAKVFVKDTFELGRQSREDEIVKILEGMKDIWSNQLSRIIGGSPHIQGRIEAVSHALSAITTKEIANTENKKVHTNERKNCTIHGPFCPDCWEKCPHCQI